MSATAEDNSGQNKRRRLLDEEEEGDDFPGATDKCPICVQQVPVLAMIPHLKKCICRYEERYGIPHICYCNTVTNPPPHHHTTTQSTLQYPFSNGPQYHLRPDKPVVSSPAKSSSKEIPCMVDKDHCKSYVNGMYNIMIHIGQSYCYKVCSITHLKSDEIRKNVIAQLDVACSHERGKELYVTAEEVNCVVCGDSCPPYLAVKTASTMSVVGHFCTAKCMASHLFGFTKHAWESKVKELVKTGSTSTTQDSQQ